VRADAATVTHTLAYGPREGTSTGWPRVHRIAGTPHRARLADPGARRGAPEVPIRA
jgi:hypothetical protein